MSASKYKRKKPLERSPKRNPELPKISKQLLTEDLIVDKDILQQKRSFPNLHCDKLLKVPVRKSRWRRPEMEEEEVEIVELNDEELEWVNQQLEKINQESGQITPQKERMQEEQQQSPNHKEKVIQRAQSVLKNVWDLRQLEPEM